METKLTVPPLSAFAATTLRLIVLASLGATLLLVWQRELWLDEGYTYAFISAPAGIFWSLITGSEMNMAPYYLLTAAARRLTAAPWLLRLISFALSAATLVLLYRLAIQQFGKDVAVMATALLALNHYFVYHASELRSYALTLCLATMLLGITLSFWKEGRARELWGFLGVAVLLFYSHFLAGIYIGLLAIGIGIAVGKRHRGLLPLSCVLAVIGVACAVPAAVTMVANRGENIAHIEPQSLPHMIRRALDLLGGHWFLFENESTRVFGPLAMSRHAGELTMAAIVAGLILWTIRCSGRYRGQHGASISMAALTFVPLAIGVAASYLQPIMVPRYFMFTLPPFCLWMALTIRSIATVKLRALTMGALVVVTAVSLGTRCYQMLTRPPHPWTVVARHCETETPVLVVPAIALVEFNVSARTFLQDAQLILLPDLLNEATGGVSAPDIMRRLAELPDWPVLRDSAIPRVVVLDANLFRQPAESRYGEAQRNATAAALEQNGFRETASKTFGHLTLKTYERLP